MDVYLPPLLDVLHGLTVDLGRLDRKSTRLNSSHLVISYAVFCLKKKKKHHLSFSTLITLSSHTMNSSHAFVYDDLSLSRLTNASLIFDNNIHTVHDSTFLLRLRY